MKQALLSLITILVFAGVCAYLLQKLRNVEKRLTRVRQLSAQLCGVEDVQKITSNILQKRDETAQLKFQHMQQLRQRQQQRQQQQQQQQQQTPPQQNDVTAPREEEGA